MAIQKFAAVATGGTHAATDASVIDLLMPHVELVGSTNNTLRSVAHLAIGYFGRGYKDTGRFSL